MHVIEPEWLDPILPNPMWTRADYQDLTGADYSDLSRAEYPDFIGVNC